MYGGLFGDLPSTKHDRKDDDGAAKNQKETSAEKAEEESQPSKKQKPASIVSGVGKSGTSMAFMPTTLRQKKRPVAIPRAATRKATTSKVTTAQKPSEVVSIHSNSSSVNNIVSSSEKHGGISDNRKMTPSANVLPELEVESEEMRQLHESVRPEDAYDPHVPNDLLAYWDRKAMEKERIQLEREAKETLERQQRLREQLQKEREEVQKTGSVDQIVQHMTKSGMGRGRGRGVENLPAWLVQKHKDALGSSANAPSSGADPIQGGQTSRGGIVILSNLTAPGEMDDDLADEVKEECEEQCGKVTNVEVKDARPPLQPAVQVHVHFLHLDDAHNAVRLFHGRKFGDRRITAELKNTNL